MTSVLDRLCLFSKGILELCDPSTPSWAQARLSELLAEIGVVPMPTQGQPHLDFHQIVGTIVAEGVPHGQIALVEAPGFALRGDRGDLFPLRKAQVRVSSTERKDVSLTTVAPRVEQRPAPRPTFVPPAAPMTVSAPAPTTVSAPAAEKAVPADGAPAGDVAPAADRGPRPERNERGADRGPRNDRRERTERPAREPEQGRTPFAKHGTEPVGESPRLPLAPQVPAELEAKPKAVGFAPLGLNDQILTDLAAIGYNEPTPIQAEAIPVVLSGKDVLGQAQTGTGKTAAFVLPILQKLYAIESPERKPVALVLCPTRELARQVFNEFTRMAGASGARAVVIYGGTPMDDQIRALENGPHVVIGTPGRIIDHMKRRALDLSGLAMMVLDEADQMLDIGFWPDVNYIIGHTPPSRQVLLFSATFPEPVKEMAQKHMKDPQQIRITPKVITVEQVDQKYIAVSRERKNNLLAHFIETQNPPQLVVFCRTKHQTDRVAEVLKRKNMSAGAIHGDLPQTKREKILAQFRAGEIQSLIATNVAARGLDIPTVSHVVNYDIPEMPEEYVHRIGRTARNGAKGIARTFITPEDGQFLLEIEKHIGLLLEEEKIEGFEATPPETEVKRTIADMPIGQPRILKPLVGGIRLGRRRR
jgi:ATP-dependent RNA helicase DeaD